MDNKKSSVPGLSRGMQVLRLLSDKPLSVEEIVRQAKLPKTSVQRIVATLGEEGLIEKDPSSRQYHARVRFVWFEDTVDAFEQRLDITLSWLATMTGCTAEWYLPTATGQVLSRRHVPQHAEVQVRSWIGIVLPWSGYFDAVTCAGRAAWFELPRPGEEDWVFGPNGDKVNLTPDDIIDRFFRLEKMGYTMDEHFSDQGVKRIAGTIMGEHQPLGTLALAQCNVPGWETRTEENVGYLLREIGNLSVAAKALLKREERREPLDYKVNVQALMKQ